jgi:hypothetical protein
LKKLFLIVLVLVCTSTFGQLLYTKRFPGNWAAIYTSNVMLVGDLTFVYRTASDTNNVVFYIENFKPENIKSIPEKIKFYSSKICLPDYKSKIGDFIYSFNSQNELLYFYHKANRPVKH